MKVLFISQKKIFKQVPDIENKLLQIRNKREQPFTDKKIITSWNALLGIAYHMVWRYTQSRVAKTKAIDLFTALTQKHYQNDILIHSSLQDQMQSEQFLEDYASLLLFTTYLYEDSAKPHYKELIEELRTKIKKFKDDKSWMCSITQDFKQAPANNYDHPIASPTALANTALFRAYLILNEQPPTDLSSLNYQSALSYDFHNILVFSQTFFHQLHLPHKIQWHEVPANVMQIRDEQKIQDCFNTKCIAFNTLEEMKKSFIN